MKIWNHEVGPGYPTFIVAEGGSNHGGSLDAALALTDAAAAAGADAMKWQLWVSADEMYDRSQFSEEWATADKYRLPIEWLPALRDRAHERGIAFGLSSFGFGSLDEADKWVDFHKIASIEAASGRWSWDFIKAVDQKAKPTLLSSGMSEFTSCLGDKVMLHCVVAYPADLSEVNLRSHGANMDGAWGLSDHTLHPTIAPCAAVALGACVIEKHIMLFTTTVIDRDHVMGDQETPDMSHSIDPDEFNEMVRAIRDTEKALGSSEKRIRPSEEAYLRYRRGPRGLRGS